MPIEIIYMGVLAETTGKTSELIDFTGSGTEMLKLIKNKYPDIKNLSFILSHNGIIAHEKINIAGDDQIVLIPPAPGG